MRTPLVAGNWKMNLTRSEAITLANAIASKPAPSSVEVAVCPPFVYLIPVQRSISGSHVKLGAQNMYFEMKGAFTGEVSGAMLRDARCQYVIIGHSERRHIIGEDDELINAKVKAAVNGALAPILCVGEKLDQREAGETEQVVEEQLSKGLAGLAADDLSNLVIAYEPVWAIGTGRNATPQQAQDVHTFIRGWLTNKYGGEFAQQTRIQYGGSVKAANAGELMAQSEVDGALVGGASLDAEEFLKIIEATAQAKTR